MGRKKSLEEYVLEVFEFSQPEREIRWHEFRNAILTNEDVSLEIRKDPNGLSVKLSRILKQFVRDGILRKNDRAHRDVRYSLTEHARENLLKKEGSKVHASNIFVGIYRPGDSYETVRKRALKQWIEWFETMHEPEFRKQFDEQRKRELAEK